MYPYQGERQFVFHAGSHAVQRHPTLDERDCVCVYARARTCVTVCVCACGICATVCVFVCVY